MAEQQSRPIRTLDQVLGLAPSTQAPPIKTLDEVLGLGVVQQEPDYESSGYLSDLLHAGGSGLERTTAALQAVSMLAGGPDMADNIAEYYRNSTQPEYMDAFNRRLAAASTRWDNAEGWWESMGALGSGAYQILRDPEALSYSIVENAANFLPSLGTGIAGAKVGTLIAPGAGSGVGFLTGMSAGTIATELGHKALELASEFGADVTDGDSLRSVFADSDFRAEAAKQGLTKGVSIALVDALSFKLAGRVVTAPGRELNKKVEKELMDAGADIADPASVAKAYARPDVAEKIAAHTEKYIAQSNRLTPKIGRGAAALGLESTGEGFGELSGEFLASGEVKPIDALHEAFAGMGQSAAQIGISKSLSAGKKQTQKLLQEARKAQVDKVAQGKDSQIDPGALNEALRQRLDDVDTVLERQESPAPIEVAEMEREIGRVDATTPLGSVVSALPDLPNYGTYKGRLQGAVRELEGDSLVMYVPLTKEEQAAMQAGGGLKRAVVAALAEEGVTPGANQSVARVSVPTENVLLKGNWSRGQLMISPDNVALAPLVSPQQAVQETEAAQDLGPALEQEQARLQRVQAQAALEEQAELGAAEGRAERAEKAPTVSAKRAATIRRESGDFQKRLPADKLITGKGRVKGDPRKLTTNELRKVVNKYNIPVERNLSQAELQDVVLSYKRALAKPTGPSINKVLRPKGYRLSRVFNKETDAHEIHLVPVKNNRKLSNPVLAASSVDQISIPDYIDLIDERLAETGVTRSETAEVATQLQDVKAERKEEGRRVAQAAREQAAAEKKGKPTIKEAVEQAEEQFVTRDKVGVHINEEGLQNFADSLQEKEFWTKRLTKEFDAYVERLRREQALSQAPVMPIGPLKGRRTVFFEAVPDPSLPEYEPIRQLGYIQRENFTNRAAKLLQTRNGTDALLGKIANIYVKQKPGVGGYEKTINPNILMTLSPKSDTDQIADVYSWAVQYIFRQAAVPWAIPDNSLDVDSDAVTAGAHFKFKGKIGGASEALFYKELRESLGVDSGYTKISPTDIIVLNFDLDKSKFARRIGRFNGKASKKFGFQTEWFTSRGEYHEANWNEDPHGESIRDKIREAGFSDLLPFLDSRFAAFNKLAAEYGVKVPKEKATQEDGRPSRSRSDRGAREPPLDAETSPTKAPDQGAFSLAPEVKSDEVVLVHYSQQKNLTKTDPAYHGTGYQGAEKKRKESFPDTYVDRTYFGFLDYRREGGLGPNQYQAKIPFARLYDFVRDPDGLNTATTFDRVNRYEQAIKNAGYAGYYVKTGRGTVAAVFEEIELEAPGAFALLHHGTPGTWASGVPDLNFLGTGEGAQAFGWGIYFAQRKGVAEDYWTTLSPEQYFVDGKPYDVTNQKDRISASYARSEDQGISNLKQEFIDYSLNQFDEIQAEIKPLWQVLGPMAPSDSLYKENSEKFDRLLAEQQKVVDKREAALEQFDQAKNTEEALKALGKDADDLHNAILDVVAPNLRTLGYLAELESSSRAAAKQSAGDAAVVSLLSDIVETDQDYLSRARKDRSLIGKITTEQGGNLYTVELDDSVIDNLLDWDAPFSKQPPKVKAALVELARESAGGKEFTGDRWEAMVEAIDPESPYRLSALIDKDMTGELLYKALHTDTQGPGGRKTASLALNSLGVPGLKYFDGFSRGKKKGTRNIVLWDQDTLNTLEVPIPDKTFWSLQQKPALSGLSTSKAREVLQKQFGPVVDKLESEGILEIVRSIEQVPQELITGDAALRARAVYDKRTSKAYLITSRLNEGNVGKILLHEVGVHYGLRRMLGDRPYAELILDINNQKDGALKPYFDYVRESYGSRLQNESSDAFVEEVIARIAEDTSEQTLSIREKIWVAVRAFLNRLFGTNFKITDREIGYIIRGGSGFVSDLLRQKGSLRTAADQGYTPPYMLLNDSPAFGQRTIGFPEYTQPIRDFTARHIQYRVANPDGTKLGSKEESQLRKNMNRMLKHADTLGKSIKGVDVHLPIAADTTNLTSRYALFKNNRTGTELVIRVSNHSKDMATAIGSFPFVSYNNAHKQDIDFADMDKAVRMLAEGKAEGKNALEFYILHRLGDVLAPLTDKQLDRLGDYANFKRAILKVKPDLFKRLVAIETRQDLNSAAVINDDNAMFALGPPVERNEVQEGLVRELTHTKSRTLFEHLEESRLSRWDWLVQGMIDTYRPIAKLEKFGANTAQRAWQMMHLSENTHGLLSAVLNYGTPKEVTRDGQFDWYDIDRDQQGLLEVLRDLGGGNEVDNFLAWVAMNRADTLMKEGREKHFTEQQIREGMKLNRGRMEDGRNRATVYMRAMRGLSTIQKSMLDMAERAGVIDPELRKTLQTDFYVPFYREFDHKDKENIRGPSPTYDFVNMKNTIKKLQGSELGVHDILHNMVMNWTALMSASMKNRAGQAAMEAAVDAGVATKIEDDQDAAQMAFAKRHARKSKYENYVYVMEGGKRVWYNVHDPLVLNALASLTSGTLNTSWIRPFQTTKRVFTLGTTLSPAFRIRNLIRDSVNSIAVGKLNYNIFGNVATGYRAMAKGSVVESSMLAGGGGFSFGFLNDDPSAIRRLVNAGVEESRILDTTKKATGFLKEGYQWYQNVGNKIENANRAALYMQRRGEVGHLQASFESRDLLNFSSHGRFAFAQLLTAWTPFLNARLMGLDKLGRAMTGEERGRMITVTGALVLASIGYMLSMEGDPDYEELEDWVKDTYWPIKLPGGDTFFFLPKPFEIGAVTSIAETITKNFIDSTGAHAPYTAARIRKILMAQLAFDPRPQLLRPMIEVGTNKDAFLDRRIESLSWDMQKVPKTQRKRAYSSEIAVSASELMGVLLPDWLEDTDVHLSPVQIDHLIRGYLGWAGANVVASADYLLREQVKPAITGREPPPRASKRIDEMDWVGPVPFPLKSFVSSSPRRNTIYLTRLYEQMDEVKKYYAKYLHYREHGMTDEMMEVVAQRGDLLKWRKTYNSVQTQLGKISKRVRQIERSHEMTPDEKRKEIDRLTEMRGALAKRVVEARAKYDSADNPSLYKTL